MVEGEGCWMWCCFQRVYGVCGKKKKMERGKRNDIIGREGKGIYKLAE